jgi:membrane dipeptidase
MSFHADCLILDGHTDVPTRLWETPADLSRPCRDRHVDLPRLRAGGVDALVFALYVPANLSPEEGGEHARELYRLASRALIPGELEQAESAEQVRRLAGRGTVAVLLGLENGRCLSVPGMIEQCYRWGVRYVTLTHVASHEWCDASTDEPRHGGLAAEGVALIREMNRRAILPDVSHVSDSAVEQVLAVSKVPVIASHSSARALCDHHRNLPDRLIREIAARGGVVMANTFPAFVDPAACRANEERVAALGPELAELAESYVRNPLRIAPEIAELLRSHPLPAVPLSRFVDHILHLVEQAGEEHVGIGTDFDGIPETLEGFADPGDFPDLTAAFLERGLDKSGIRLILGENFLRVLELAEQGAG